ncbi:MAG: hypothetical protein V1778_00805 [bacterium]
MRVAELFGDDSNRSDEDGRTAPLFGEESNRGAENGDDSNRRMHGDEIDGKKSRGDDGGGPDKLASAESTVEKLNGDELGGGKQTGADSTIERLDSDEDGRVPTTGLEDGGWEESSF